MWKIGMKSVVSVLVVLLSLVFVVQFSGCDSGGTPVTPKIEQGTTNTAQFDVSEFQAATDCQPCHPTHYDEWSGSMHAYALKDPVFQKIREAGQSMYANALDQACVQCHAAIGSRSGETPWGPMDLNTLPPVVAEGIGCDMCHTVTSISRMFNNGLVLDPNGTKYGTIENPVATPFHKSEYSPLYANSEYCGACHDFNAPSGFELENLFREWRELGLGKTGKTCNDCHMQTYTGKASPDGPDRTLHRHDFVGVDVAMIDFPNKPQQALEVDKLLKSALLMQVVSPASVVAGDTISFQVQITNDSTGHSVPSGVPFNREMWLAISVTDNSSTELFWSGKLDSSDDLMDSIADPFLFNAQATMIRADGQATGATWDATGIVNPAIKVGETRSISYKFEVPLGTTGPLSVSATLRFRSFSPKLFRDLDLGSLLPLPIVDMATDTTSVTVQ